MLPTFAVFVALAQALEAPAAPPPRDPLLRRAAALFDTLDFENARAMYERALSVRLGSVEELAEAYLGLGLCDATLGDDEQAKQSFLRALAVKPDAKLEGADISPRQRAPFDAARAESRGRPAIRVDHVPPRFFPAGAPVKLEVTVDNDWLGLVAGVRLALRRQGQGWEEVAVGAPPPYEPTLPPLGAGPVEYWVQAIDARGSPLAAWQSAEAPHRVMIAEPSAQEPPLYKRWWLWAAVGGVVAASVTAGVLAVQLQAPEYRLRTQPAP